MDSVASIHLHKGYSCLLQCLTGQMPAGEGGFTSVCVFVCVCLCVCVCVCVGGCVCVCEWEGDIVYK